MDIERWIAERINELADNEQANIDAVQAAQRASGYPQYPSAKTPTQIVDILRAAAATGKCTLDAVHALSDQFRLMRERPEWGQKFHAEIRIGALAHQLSEIHGRAHHAMEHGNDLPESILA